jgi:hypothetical protein
MGSTVATALLTWFLLAERRESLQIYAEDQPGIQPESQGYIWASTKISAAENRPVVAEALQRAHCCLWQAKTTCITFLLSVPTHSP